VWSPAGLPIAPALPGYGFVPLNRGVGERLTDIGLHNALDLEQTGDRAGDRVQPVAANCPPVMSGVQSTMSSVSLRPVTRTARRSASTLGR
jgi:hypothetical protein